MRWPPGFLEATAPFPQRRSRLAMAAGAAVAATGLALVAFAATGGLSGQAIGITVAGTVSGMRYTGFAVPINEALVVAKSIQASHSG
jgi:hypothetical protein